MTFKDYFSFSKGEKRGVIFLLSVIIVAFVSIHFIKLLKQDNTNDFAEFDKEISAFEKELKTQLKNDSLIKLDNKKLSLPSELFAFNPNSTHDTDWLKLGFKDWQIKTINNYKLKGGQFRIKSDVRKIYGLTDTLYSTLYPYIQLPEDIENTSFKTELNYTYNYSEANPQKKTNTLIVDINNADTSELKKLKGIGSAYSKRIVKYREALGGFIKIEQLKEVYGISEDIYNQNITLLSLTNSHINQININSADIETLKQHPYIDWNTAKTIVAYRKSHGNYKDVKDIKQIHLITEEIYTKIAPYLTIN